MRYQDLREQRRNDLLKLPTEILAQRLDELCEKALKNLTDSNKGSLRTMFQHAASITEAIDYAMVLSHKLKIPFKGFDFTIENIAEELEKKAFSDTNIENIRDYGASTKAWRAEADRRNLFTGNKLKRTFDAVRATRLSKEIGIIKAHKPS